MAELFRAHAISGVPEGDIAIKRLLPHLAVDDYYRAMFLDEAELTARLGHPNIIRTFDYGTHEDQLFIAMELVDGLDGLSVLRECATRRVRMPTELAVHVAQEVLAALEFAHEQRDESGKSLGVVHRDISPANVLFATDGRIKLADFGIAHAAQQKHRSKDGTLKGKYGYMSPEQVADMELDARSDIFSVGVLLAEMLTGRRLFAAPTELDVLLMVRDANLGRLDQYGEHLGMDLHRMLRKALKKDPAERYSSANEFREVLSEWMYLHHKSVKADEISELVTMLYDDAWARKRARTAKLVEEMARQNAARAAGDDAAASEPARPAEASGDVEIEVDLDQVLDVERSGELDDPASPQSQDSIHEPDTKPVVDTTPDDKLSEDHARPPGSALGRIAIKSRRVASRRAVEERVLPRAAKAAAGKNRARITERQVRAQPGTLPIDESLHEDRDLRDTVEMPSPPSHESPATSGTAAGTGSQRSFHATDPLFSPSLDFDDSEISSVLGASSMIADVEAAGAGNLPSLDNIEGTPDEVGDFARTSPISAFFRLAISHSTGLMVATVGSVCKEIYLRGGVPEYVASNLASEMFGEHLVRRGIITSGELSMALAMDSHYGGKLGETLVGLGLLQPLDVFRHLSVQLRQKLVDVCTWTKGTYHWYQGRENPRPAFPLDIDPFEILGMSSRALPVAVIDEWFDRIAQHVPAVRGDAPVELAHFRLGRALDRVRSDIDGIRSVAELAGKYAEKGEATDWLRVLYLLVHTEQVALTPR